MTTAFCGTLEEARELHERGRLFDRLRDGFRESFHRPAENLVASWENSIPPFLEALAASEFDKLPVLFEMRMPIGDERADVVLLDGAGGDRTGLVVEMKQWSSVKRTDDPVVVDVPVEGHRPHPSIQALSYQGKLHVLHSEGVGRVWKALCLMENLDGSYRQVLESGDASSFATRAPILYKGDSHRLAELCRQFLIPTEKSIQDAVRFNDAPYEQTKAFFEIISKHANEIAENAAVAVAESGAAPTSEQLLLLAEVLQSAKQGEQRIFLVRGGPGSGKTLVAVHLLLRALTDPAIRERKGAALALRNNRLMATLRECFERVHPAAPGAMFFSSVPRSGRGIGDAGFAKDFGLVVCDEAQRFTAKNIRTIMGRAPTVVFLFDESQILNPTEEGTTQTFEDCAGSVGKEVAKRNLSCTLRCRGGEEYHAWVEGLLDGGSAAASRDWTSRYLFRVFQRPEDMIGQLRTLGRAKRVALVASFTESRGKLGSPAHKENVRVGWPLPSGFDLYKDSTLEIRWLMDPKKEYAPYWLGGRSNRLEHVSSIYGCQGFEADYVGVFWGRDFVRRGPKWDVGDRFCITDNIDGFANVLRADPSRGIDLLRNRYRVFLTRGMLGTFVFCEDNETRDFLSDVVRNL